MTHRVLINVNGRAVLATKKQVAQFNKLVPEKTRLPAFYSWCYGWWCAKPKATVDEFLRVVAKMYPEACADPVEVSESAVRELIADLKALLKRKKSSVRVAG